MTRIGTQNHTLLMPDEASPVDSHAAGTHDTASRIAPGRLSDFATLTKPRITMMVVITAFIGFALGEVGMTGSWAQIGAVAGTLVGTALSCMAASVFNQLFERDTDALMERTADRPLPAGRVSTIEARLLGIALAAAGVGLLWATTNWLAAGAAAFTIASYAWVYTPLKRATPMALWIGAIPGAMPPIIGYAAATGRIGEPAWLLFAIMFVWQIPHFLAIAWLYRDEYARAGLRMLPVIEPDGASTFRQILATCLVLLPMGLLPTLLGVSGMIYFGVALVCGGLFLGVAIALVRTPTRQWARRLFFASLIYLPVVLAALMLNQV